MILCALMRIFNIDGARMGGAQMTMNAIYFFKARMTGAHMAEGRI